MVNEELKKQVADVIDQIRPYLVADGGNIDFVDLTDDLVVKVQLQGACASCPMSQMTLKNGVEAAIKKALPQITAVESV